MKTSRKAIVIGSGIGGMASSIRLALLGFNVQVFEKNNTYGGKIGQIEMGGYRFDTGPSLFTMPHLVDELYEIAGYTPRDHFSYKRKEKACFYFWEDKTKLIAWSDPDKFDKESHKVLNTPKGEVTTYLNNSARHYNITTPIFLAKSLHRLDTYLSQETLNSLIKLPGLDLMGSMHDLNKKRLSHPKLVQLFDRFATYNGSDPYQAPALLNLIPHLEHGQGTFFPNGGIRSIVDNLYALAQKLGVQFHFDEPVREIITSGNTVKGVLTAKRVMPGDIVMNNMDVYPTYKYLLPDIPMPSRIRHQERSSSAMIFYWGIGKKFPQLDLHNILFSEDYDREFKGIFGDLPPTNDPTVYINISSKEEPGDAPSHGENWFVMINMPPNNGQNWSKLLRKMRKHVLDKIERTLGINIEPFIEVEDFLDPVLIETRTSSYMGSLYGTSSNNRLAAFLRHPNFHANIKGLYFTGGSVHPGGGIPLCLLSAKIACDLVSRDYNLKWGKRPSIQMDKSKVSIN